MRYAVLVVLILAGATGCAAGRAAAPRSTEQILAEAGFHVAARPQRVAELVSSSQNGGVSYVFSDPAGCHCVYVGGGREYREYQRLRLEQGIKHLNGFVQRAVWDLAERHSRRASAE
jgi:hypothetical protein